VRHPASSAPAARAVVAAERVRSAAAAAARVRDATDPAVSRSPSNPPSLGRNADLGVGLRDLKAGLLAQESHER
jgi:hypothetical protein